MAQANEVVISAVRLERSNGEQQLSAEVDGDTLWFRFPDTLTLTARAEPFLPAALMEAMVRGAPVRIDHAPALSPRLLSGLDRLQRLLTTWNEEDFQLVPIVESACTSGTDTSQRDADSTDRIISCFSGGIDSSYTFSCLKQEISHLLLVQGFDAESDAASWRQNVAARQAFADSEGKQLIPVASNVRSFFSKRRLSWNAAHGSVLAALGVGLAARRFYIPASFTYNELFPWGSHPLLDPCWSTEATEIVHHGIDTSRTGKTVVIADQQNTLDHLQVCWRGVAGNCGDCPKCLRTSLALHVLQKRSASLPPFQHARQLRWLKPGNHASMVFTEDLIRFCRAQQRPDLVQQLRGLRRRYLLKYHSAEMMKLLFGQLARRISRRLWPKTWHQDRSKIQAGRIWL